MFALNTTGKYNSNNLDIHRLRSCVIFPNIFNMNKSCIIIFSIVLLTIYRSTDAKCREHGQSCSDSSQCTTQYCRDQHCIYWGESVDNDVGQDPCATYDCSQGYECVRDQVTCVKAPCLPTPRCAWGAC